MRTIVLGSQGQLGRDLIPRLHGEVFPLARHEAELTDHGGLRVLLTANRPDVVINCAAYNLVDQAESDCQTAFAVNAFAVRNLACVCADLNATLVHFSTDYVFGLEAERSRPFFETDPPGPVSVYGASKLVGEYFVRSLCPKHFVIRTCGLYGAWGSGGKGKNFVETMLRLMTRGSPIRVVNDQRCTPSYTVDVAQATVSLIQTSPYGLYHVANSGECTWFEFASEISRLTGGKTEVQPITSREFTAIAFRPRFSVLDCSELFKCASVQMPHWHDALNRYLSERRIGTLG